MITVQAKTFGQRRHPLYEFQLPPWEPGATAGSPLTLRDLITRIVHAEVDAFHARQLDNTFLRALTADEIAVGASAGAVRSGGSEVQQEVDPQLAVATALQAFDDGIYYVVIDGSQCRSLDEQVFVVDDSSVVFLRLVPLAGG
jgi:hypothetical protein